MMELINGLPEGMIGVEAHGKVTKDDYETVIIPLLDEAYKSGQKVKFLYHLAPDFSGFSAGAAWDDLSVGLRYFRMFQACAFVTDSEWISKSAQLASFLMPCPFRIFKGTELQSAKDWLSTAASEHLLEASLIADKGVLLLEPKASLTKADFAYLASLADPWIEQHGKLNGLVIHAKKFPGWENLGGLISHIRFVKEHHRRVKRIGVATDAALLELLPKIGSHFVDAEAKAFGYEELGAALDWAALD